MSEPAVDRQEVLRLTESFCAGRANDADAERLSDLICGDVRWAQLYVEYIDLHAELAETIGPSGATTLATAVAGEGRQPSRSRGWHAIAFAAAAAACVTLISTLALVDIGGGIPRAVAGRVTSISDGAAFDGDPPVLGEILRDGAGIKIEDGFLTVTLGDGVKLDVVGPTKMTVENDGRVSLRAGLVAGRVGEAGRGFTVATEDADVVDLGTRFLVHKDQSVGTVVRVEEGRVEARLKDRGGSAVRVIDLIAGQTAKLNVYNETAEQTADVFDFRDRYEIVRQSKGEIERFSGSARPVIWSGYELAEGDFLTGGSVYVIPERRQVVADSAVHSADIVRIPDEDTLVDSYLFHFDFNEADGHVYQTGRGSVTFGSDVVAIITDAAGLRETDGVYGLERGTFDTADHRGIETETDSVTVSDDGRTVAFDIDAESGRVLDEFRVLVLSAP